MTKLTILFLLLTVTTLSGCDDPPTASPCEMRAMAICTHYASCFPGNDWDSCITGNVGFCETAGAGKPDEEKVHECVDALETATCDAIPTSCRMRVSN